MYKFTIHFFLFRLKEIFILVIVIVSFILFFQTELYISLLRDEQKSLAASAFSLPCKTYTGYYILVIMYGSNVRNNYI